MSESLRDINALSQFLLDWQSARYEDEIEFRTEPDGTEIGVMRTGQWKAEETFNLSSSRTLFNGRLVVSSRGVPLWVCGHHAIDILPDETGEDMLDFVDKVESNYDPDIPVSPLNGTENDRFRYERVSLLAGDLTIARFAMAETIVDKLSDRVIIDGTTMGGWITE